MNIRCSSAMVVAAATCAMWNGFAAPADAQETSTPIAGSATAVTTTDPVQLSHSAEDILKLSRAKVGDDVIIAFIQGGSRRFDLTASEIVRLRNEGVSDRVLAAMVNPQSPTPPAPQPPPQPAAPASAVSVSAAQDATGNTPAAPATVYVVPTSAPASYAPYPYPYYSGYSYPAVSVGIGFGTGWGYGYYGGCYRSGYYGRPYYGGYSHGGSLTVVGGQGGGSHGGGSSAHSGGGGGPHR